MHIYIAKYCQDKEFYVYDYLWSKKSKYGSIGSPYYIGKGKDDRATSKLHSVHQPKDKNNIKFSPLMNEADAFQLEMFKIFLFGRIDIDTGCLRNRTDGGQGLAGLRHSTESRKKMSKPKSAETVLKMIKSRKLRNTQEFKDKISNSLKNHPVTQITRDKISKKKKNIPKTEEFRKRVSNTLKGIIPWNKGIIYSDEIRKKIGTTTLGTIFVTNKELRLNKRIVPQKFPEYEQLGYIRGLINYKK